jgi:predicted amidophosphoribosyltransferase
MDLFRNVENFVFGAECLGCGHASDQLDPWLCPSCAAELDRASKVSLFPGPDVLSLYPMRPITRRLVHALKYKGIPGMATYLVRHSSARKDGMVGSELDLWPRPLYFVPVPLHRARFRERGYNQAEKIAAALAVSAGGRVCKWLRRKTFVVSQTKLSKEERERNVADAFECVLQKGIPTRGTVVIVDDVYTTGATTGACLAAFERVLARSACSGNGPLLKVCTLLYDEPASAVADYVADCQMEWDFEGGRS